MGIFSVAKAFVASAAVSLKSALNYPMAKINCYCPFQKQFSCIKSSTVKIFYLLKPPSNNSRLVMVEASCHTVMC